MKEPLYPVEIKDIDLSKLDFLGEEYFAINKNNSRVTIYSEEDIEGMLITHIYLPSSSTPLKQLSDEEIKDKIDDVLAYITSVASYQDGKLDSWVAPSSTEMASEKLVKLFKSLSPQSDHINPIELLEWVIVDMWTLAGGSTGGLIWRNPNNPKGVTTIQLVEIFKTMNK